MGYFIILSLHGHHIRNIKVVQNTAGGNQTFVLPGWICYIVDPQIVCCIPYRWVIHRGLGLEKEVQAAGGYFLDQMELNLDSYIGLRFSNRSPFGFKLFFVDT